VEPVEINAGEYYLRQLRADDRLDDRPALVEGFADPVFRRFEPDLRIDTLAEAGEYVVRRTAEWAAGTRCSWAVAEPTTGALLGEVGLKKLDLLTGHGEASIWVHPAARRRGVAVTSLRTVLRFGFGGLGLHEVHYLHAETNTASAGVAERCGFTPDGFVGHRLPGIGRQRRWILRADQLCS
jgi:RimJ/RimL family protein N-acetyltransferase